MTTSGKIIALTKTLAHGEVSAKLMANYSESFPPDDELFHVIKIKIYFLIENYNVISQHFH